MTREDPVIDPDELDITADERVERIDENRYVISPEGQPSVDNLDIGFDEDDVIDEVGISSKVSSAEVSRWLAASLTDTGFTYGFDATLSVDDAVVRHRLVSNDVSTAFETLLAWFVRHTTSDVSTAEALGILLGTSDLAVVHPPGTLERLLRRHALSPEDRIEDLVRAVRKDGGMRISRQVGEK